MSSLDHKPQIWKLALDLGIKAPDRPVRSILEFVRAKVRRIAKKYKCTSLNELLLAVAADVETVFEEVHSTADIQRIKSKYMAKGENGFANLEAELRQQDYGITLRRSKPEKWEPLFVSVIDCRGEKSFRSYFTKWHELAHLLTLTEQLRLVYRRTHDNTSVADPEELLMDVIAGELGFLKDYFSEVSTGEISFATIGRIRNEFCPAASLQSATIGIVKALPMPCVLLEAALKFKKSEQTEQLPFNVMTHKAPKSQLRITHVTVNDAARQENINLFKQLRVPERSIISKVFRDGGYAEQIENLDWWETSQGGCFDSRPVTVRAKQIPDGVVALLIPN